MASLNWVDYILLAILILSTLSGLGRGLIREVFSLLVLVAAVVIASMFASQVAAYFSSSSAGQYVATSVSSMGSEATTSLSAVSIGLSFLALFFLVMIVGSIVTYFFTGVTALSLTNRLLGGLFGFGRGLLFNLLLIFLLQLTAVSQESWWTQSRFVIAYQPAVQWLSNLVAPGLQALKAKVNSLDTQYAPSASAIYNKVTNKQ